MIKCIIIDDEQFSINAILKYIKQTPWLETAGIYTDPRLAIEKILPGNNVDLFLMDIDMPLLSGIELAGMLRHKAKKLVFTTAHSEYAFNTFEVKADAYLLKPYSFLTFYTTIERLFQQANRELLRDKKPRTISF